MKKNVEQEIEVLKGRIAHLLTNKPYNTNRNHVDKFANQIRYLEKSYITIEQEN